MVNTWNNFQARRTTTIKNMFSEQKIGTPVTPVFELEAQSGQIDEQTDGRSRPVMHNVIQK